MQIEYEYTAGDESSVRLLKWYEAPDLEVSGKY